jgi:hypothetical protein
MWPEALFGPWGAALSQELMQSGPQCHSAIMPARIPNEINELQWPKNQG